MSSAPGPAPDAPASMSPDEREQELSTLREQLQLLAGHLHGIIFEFDAEARYLRAWTPEPALLARPEHELLGRTIVEVLGDEAGRPFVERVRRVLATGVPESFEYMLVVQGGQRWFAAEATAPRRAPGREPTVTFLVRDITERRQMEAQLRRVERLAAAGMLAAGVAHEVNNPLGYIMLNLERARTAARARAAAGDKLDDLLDALQIAWEGAERVRLIVRDLTTLVRTEDDAPTPRDVRRALDLAAATAATELDPRARLVRDYREVPKVLASEARLVQLFRNLVVNAAQAIAAGAPADNEVRLSTGTNEAGDVVAEVRDTGGGITPDVLGRIFDPFFTTRGDAGGTGLGLWICHGIVDSLGGRITVESAPGRGAVFRVVLPAHRG